MSTTTTPSMTLGAAGNADASAALAAGANRTFDVDITSKYGDWLQFASTPGTAAATNGLKVEWGFNNSTASRVDTSFLNSFILPSVTSTLAIKSIFLPTPGKYRFKMSNLDVTNAITTVEVTSGAVDNQVST